MTVSAMTPGQAFQQDDQTGRVRFISQDRSPDEILTRALGPAYTEYREKWRATENFSLETDWPLHLDVDTNYTCNLRCVMCPLGAGGFAKEYWEKQLDFKLYRLVVSEGAARGLSSIRLGITGEPLLRPDIFDFIRLARDLGIPDIMLITNGILLDRRVSRKLIEAGLTRLMVSIDAVKPDTYSRIRRGGRLERVVGGVLGFLSLREEMGLEIPLVRVSFINMSLNAGERENFEDFWTGRADYLSFQEYANILEREDTNFFNGPVKWPAQFRCADPWQRMSLFVDGSLFPCCSDFARLSPVGDARRASVAEVWKSEEVRRLRRLHAEGRFREDPICRRCAAAVNPRLKSD